MGFCDENEAWLPDFALFMALKDVHNGAPWSEWKAPLRNRDAKALEEAANEQKDSILFWKVLQYLFFKACKVA